MVTAWFGPPLCDPHLHEAAAVWGAVCRGPSRESWNPQGHGEGVRDFPVAVPAAQPGPGQNGAVGDIGVSSLPPWPGRLWVIISHLSHLLLSGDLCFPK